MTYSAHIGRVGVLAVALGIGFAIGTGVAWADDTGGSSSSGNASSADAGKGNYNSLKGPERASQAAEKGNPGPRASRGAPQNDGSSARTGTVDDAEDNGADSADIPQSNRPASADESKPSRTNSPAIDRRNGDVADTSKPATPQPANTLSDPLPAVVVPSVSISGTPGLAESQTDAEAATQAAAPALQSVSENSEYPTETIEVTTNTAPAAVPQMFAAPEPTEAQPNIPMTISPGAWNVYNNNPTAGHPIPAGPPATAAILSVHWMRREAERAAQQQTPIPLAQTTSLTDASSASAEPSAVLVDDTALLQASFDALRPGDTLTLESRTYYYSDNLYIRQSSVQIVGNGATLYSTNPDAAAVVIQGNNVTLSDLNLSAPTGQVREDGTNQTRLVFGGDGNVIRDVTITGGASAGVYITGASNFLLERVTVQDTAADGVQITNGSNNGVLQDVTTLRTGDDAIAIVSYQYPALGTVHDITINNPVVDGAGQRGLVVTGGLRITFNNVDVSNTALSGIWIGSQPAPFYTQGVDDVTVNGGTLTNTNSGGLPLGAVAVVAQNPTTTVSNVTVENLTIVNTPPSSYTNVGLYTQGGSLDDITFRNIAIWQPVPTPPLPFYTNAPTGTYTTTGFTVNGVPVTVTPVGVAV
ncbi:right-handed parallel beta-helix repeat-containing protein [Mycobacterium sp. B14F4]|uniref:right-handed parallel beta-helix repeat-containing protein n=1 Tax=Mycobacterium sp. B14F4 TaxID=3153565 RepID=UPI00325CB1CF